jgi:hypothetical protein
MQIVRYLCIQEVFPAPLPRDLCPHGADALEPVVLGPVHYELIYDVFHDIGHVSILSHHPTTPLLFRPAAKSRTVMTDFARFCRLTDFWGDGRGGEPDVLFLPDHVVRVQLLDGTGRRALGQLALGYQAIQTGAT